MRWIEVVDAADEEDEEGNAPSMREDVCGRDIAFGLFYNLYFKYRC